MAVTFDTHFEKGASPSGASPFAYVSNAGTVAGTIGNNSNRVLIAYVCFQDLAVSAVAMTWDSITMTPIGTVFHVTSATHDYYMYLFGLIAPNIGAKTISVSWTGGTVNSICLGAVSVFAADQSTGWNNNTTNSGTGTPCTITVTTTNGSMAIDGHVDNNGSALVIATGTQDWQERALSGNYAMARNPAAGASTTISWTLTGAVEWGEVGVNVIPSIDLVGEDDSYSVNPLQLSNLPVTVWQ